ncbi:MAG: PcfJ domain-containing protein [Myxococcota bacterium]
MRKNRQKLHRELRLHAEALKAEAKRRRHARRLAQQRVHAAVTRVRRAGPPALAAYTRNWPSVSQLLQLANVDKDTTDKVHRLCKALSGPLPSLVSPSWLPWLLLVSLPAWARPIDSLRMPRGSFRRKRDAVVLHLFARYPVPPFLLRALDVEPLAVARVPLEDRWAVEVLAEVGRGGSVRALVGTERFPTPLTRKMVHLLLEATADHTPISALRRAQVEALDGPRDLLARLLATRLGDLHGPDPRTGEPFLQEAIGWLCRRPALHHASPGALDDLLGWALDQRRVNPGWSLEGRTADSVAPHVATWRKGRAIVDDALPDLGVPPYVEGEWSVVQVACRRDLFDEGAAMRHCVGMYHRLVARRKVAVFSLRKAGVRQATIEVAVGAGAVVQAKGPANRALTAEERAVLTAWAELAHLRIAAT